MWVYAAARDKWESRDNEGLPGNFGAGRMVYLPSQKRLLLFGGGDTGREVWYDPAAKKWEPAPKDAPVPARSYHGMCTDARGERVFVLGGTTGGFTGKMVPGDLWIGSLSPGKK